MNDANDDHRIPQKLAAKRLGKTVKSLNEYRKKHPTFPKRTKDGDHKQSPVFYMNSEITDWLSNMKREES